MDTTNNGSESLNSKFNKTVVGGFYSPLTLARAIHAFKYAFINEKEYALGNDRMRKRKKQTRNRFERLNEIITNFDSLSLNE